jgi:RNA polymerase sigma-70 factor (ECF subfamily)
VLDGDSAAFRDLVVQYHARVFRIALGYTRDAAESEDIAQEVFLRAYRSLWSYDTDRPFAAWLFTIAANVALSRLKKNRRAAEVLGDYRQSLAFDGAGHAERDASNRDLLVRVGEMLSELPPRQREAFLLRYYLEMRHEEVARFQNRSAEAVRQDVLRARKRLLFLLSEKGVGP